MGFCNIVVYRHVVGTRGSLTTLPWVGLPLHHHPTRPATKAIHVRFCSGVGRVGVGVTLARGRGRLGALALHDCHVLSSRKHFHIAFWAKQLSSHSSTVQLSASGSVRKVAPVDQHRDLRVSLKFLEAAGRVMLRLVWECEQSCSVTEPLNIVVEQGLSDNK